MLPAQLDMFICLIQHTIESGVPRDEGRSALSPFRPQISNTEGITRHADSIVRHTLTMFTATRLQRVLCSIITKIIVINSIIW
jgi:hypothetical protein